MPCKTGTREAIEARRRRIREERERELTDPLGRFWRDLVERVDGPTDGLSGLTEREKQYFAVCLLDGEVCNGGYDQYFFNHAGAYYTHALLGLKDMGAEQTLALLLQAKQVLFAFNDVPEETVRRRAALRKSISASQTVLLDQLASLHWKDPDDLKLRCEAFARRHKLI